VGENLAFEVNYRAKNKTSYIKLGVWMLTIGVKSHSSIVLAPMKVITL